MGTTLTGTTPQDTYDSLIKVTDNGPLSATAKYLSDGLGNDSALALSTAFVGSGTTAISSWSLFKGFQTIGGNSFVGYEDQAELWSNAFYDGAFKYYANGFATRLACINGEYDFNTAPENTSGAGAAATLTTRLKITNTGNVGIGTTAPEARLDARLTTNTNSIQKISRLAANNASGELKAFDVSYTGSANVMTIGTAAVGTDPSISVNVGAAEVVRFISGGLTFNGDTAAANALDDYEEGTFTATLVPNVSGSITLSTNSCTYTKIGRQVTIKGQLVVSSVSSPSGGLAIFSGLPFTTINSNAGRGVGTAMYFPSVGLSSSLINYQLQNAVEWNLVITAASIAAGDEFYITLTYFV